MLSVHMRVVGGAGGLLPWSYPHPPTHPNFDVPGHHFKEDTGPHGMKRSLQSVGASRLSDFRNSI